MWKEQLFMILFGLLCGSVLFGSFLPRVFKNVDVVRMSADHNPGTANAMKYAGVPIGMLCLIGDILKGAMPIHLAIKMGLVTGSLFPLVMVAPVFGHAYSLFHHGKGGKAIATSFGVLLGLAPLQTELLALLCILYLVNSLVFVIKPHTRRTRITFLLFALGNLAMLFSGKVAGEICGGALLIAGVVVHKNSRRQQRLEALGMCLEEGGLEEGHPGEAGTGGMPAMEAAGCGNQGK